MIILPLYALYIWFLAFRWRRTWRGYAVSAAGGLAVLLLAIIGDKYFGGVSDKVDRLDLLKVIFWAEGAAVFFVGTIIASAPRSDGRVRCLYCRYDLSGHAHEQIPVCPECGMPADGFASMRSQRLNPQQAKQAIEMRKKALELEFEDPETAARITRNLAELRAARKGDDEAGRKCVSSEASPAGDAPGGADDQHQQRGPERQAPAQGAELRI
ncbi:MAG: hypothetical protein IBJ18_10120 [Phycisphaerales bacterium]|nr:hypothetical protein [Phycisphaerales bacterium]